MMPRGISLLEGCSYYSKKNKTVISGNEILHTNLENSGPSVAKVRGHSDGLEFLVISRDGELGNPNDGVLFNPRYQ